MSDQLPDVPSLRSIDPPPGGLTRLRAAIEEDTERRHSRVRWLFAVVPVAAVIALVLWNRRELPIELPPVEAPTAIADPAIAPDFYWVARTPRDQTRPGVSYIDASRTAPIGRLDP